MLVIQRDKLAGFKNRLSQYLKEIGLNKKRYNDGYYYYGIVDIYNLLKL
jgi:arginine repressor